MAKIVYGVSGEGSGHSSRAREMINHLEQLGHTVKVVSYDRGCRNLKNDFDVFETEGLHIIYANHIWRYPCTVNSNKSSTHSGWPS